MSDEVTTILRELTDAGCPTLSGEVASVYDELRALAVAYLRRERPDHTLQATALVHEAYVRLAGSDAVAWNDRTHFFRIAAKTMRRILVNHAVARRTAKRGGAWGRVAIDEITVGLKSSDIDLIALDETLTSLSALDPQMATVVELKFFGGCTNEQTARVLGISERTVEREWRLARAWLRERLDDH